MHFGSALFSFPLIGLTAKWPCYETGGTGQTSFFYSDVYHPII